VAILSQLLQQKNEQDNEKWNWAMGMMKEIKVAMQQPNKLLQQKI